MRFLHGFSLACNYGIECCKGMILANTQIEMKKKLFNASKISEI